MATRSIIGIENEDGTITSVYCHYDGYVDGVGRTLLVKWCSRESAEALLALGDLSSLGDDLPSTVAFHRDRGELKRRPHLSRDVTGFMSERQNCGAQYCYLIDRSGEWFYSTANHGLKPLLPAVAALEEMKARNQDV